MRLKEINFILYIMRQIIDKKHPKFAMDVISEKPESIGQIYVTGVDGVQVLEKVEVVHDGLKASDFSVKSILDSGMTDLLKPVPLMTSSGAEMVDKMEAELSSINSYAANVTAENVTNIEK